MLVFHVDDNAQWTKGVYQILHGRKIRGEAIVVRSFLLPEEAFQSLDREPPRVLIQDLCTGGGTLSNQEEVKEHKDKSFDLMKMAAEHGVNIVVLSNIASLGTQPANEYQEEVRQVVASPQGRFVWVTKDEYDETDGRALIRAISDVTRKP